MDDLYGDLENYNDVNAFEELKGENSDLKTKLDDYEVKYAILQEEFDKLAASYKTLEVNFSSLLKTARAEVARKSQIITTLNSEKDAMILNAIQNSDKSKHSFRFRNIREKSSNRKSRHDEMDPRLMKIVEKAEIKSYEPGLGLDNRERIREKRRPSTDTVSSGNTEDTNALENKLKKLASYDIDDSKENIVISKRALTLKHRRKSMPIASKPCAKFSSDEDDDNCIKEKHSREWLPREDKISKSFDRHKPSHKISETSGIDEKYSSYHESSRETYYKGKSQKYSDKYRSVRDKFESRRKWNYSPERKRRGARKYPEDTYQRPEVPQHRVLKSPTVERYDPQQRFRERRSVKEQNSTQNERLELETVHPQPKLGKHKLNNDDDEPSNKRARTSSSSQPTQENTTGRPKDKVVIEDRLSCQSPDYLHSDVVSTQPKEIMSTAATKLEDPRLQSKRYVKKKHGDVLVYLSVSGRDKELKLIDTSTWDRKKEKKKKELPEALKNPPNYTGGNTQDLYNFDNPMLNISEESGEIHSESNDMNMTDFVTESFVQDYENERINQENAKINQENAKINRYVPEEPKQVFSIGQRDNHIPKEAERRLPPVRYKLTKPVLAESESTNPLGLLIEQMKHKCGVSTSKAHGTKLDVDQTFGESPLKNSAKDKMEESQLAREIRDRRKTTAREIVAQDLELSDDTYDNLVIKKNNNKEKIDTPETELHERIREKHMPIRKKSRKVKSEAEKQTEIPQQAQVAMIITDSKSNKKTKNKSSKQKSTSPKVTKEQEVETSEKTTSANSKVGKIRKEVSDNAELENSQNKTSNQPKIEKIQSKSTNKPEAEKGQNKTRDQQEVQNVKKKISEKREEKVRKKSSDEPEVEKVRKQTSDRPEVENVKKKIIDKAHKGKVDEKINDPLNIKMVVKKASNEQEAARIQNKTNENSKLEKDPKIISIELEVEKVSMKTSEALEEEKLLKSASNIPEVEKLQERISEKREEKVSKKSSVKREEKKSKKSSDETEVEKVRKQTSDRPEVENVTKKIIDKSHKGKVDEKINDPLNIKMVVKKASNEQEAARIQNKTNEKSKLEKDPKIISIELEVEKVSMKTSEALEEEKLLKSASNIPEVEQHQERISEKREEKVSKKSSDETEVEKVRNQTSDRPEVENVQKKTSSKPELERNPEETCDGDKSEKKTIKSKDTKAHDKKAKFSELFGDSCSLITPEDLGVPIAPTESANIYIPLFEDAQDSVDVSEKMLRETKPAPTTTSSPEGDQYKLNKEELEPDMPAVSSTDIKGKADNVMVSIPINITPNMDITNVIAKEPVSTVIISTGMQPAIDNNARIKLNTEQPQQLNIPEGPIALATSTPFKRLLEAEVESCNSSERDSKKDDTSSVNHSYDSNTDPQSEDVPDVRIFVRRRRRMKKSNVK